MKNDLLNQIELVLKKVFHSNEIIITESTMAKDIHGWDSLTHMTVIAELEEYFHVQFTFDEVSDFNCIGDIMQVISKKSSQK
jgi:acyl carrier protein